MTDIYSTVKQDAARNGGHPPLSADEIRHREQIETLERTRAHIETFIADIHRQRARLEEDLALHERRRAFLNALIARERETPTEVLTPPFEPTPDPAPASPSAPKSPAPSAPSATVHDGGEQGGGSLLSGAHPVTPPPVPAAPASGLQLPDRDESIGKLGHLS